MSKCIVTGGCGFIGSAVVDQLIADGHEVTVIDNLSTGKVENLHDKAKLIERDIEDEVVWNILDSADYVFHLAALARIQPSIKDPVSSHKVNVNGTLNVLEYCREHKAKLIFSSSSSIYKGDKLPTHENDEIEPKSPYALQKFIAEMYIQIYGDLYQTEYCILRYFNVYGERQILDGAYAAVIGIFLDQKAKGKTLTITNDGEQRRDFTYVKDVAKANVMAMGWSGVCNIGTGSNYSINEIAAMVGGKTEFIGNRVGEARSTLADNRRAREAGWQPTMTIDGWVNANKL